MTTDDPIPSENLEPNDIVSTGGSTASDDAPAADNTPILSTSFVPLIKPHPIKSVAYVTVSDPVQFNDGLKGKYTVYRVAYDPELEALGNSDSNGESYSPFLPHPTSTQHRYSSFRTLYNLLSKEKPGAIIPPLPEKLIKDRFSTTCLEERRWGLELFLRRICIHPELHASTVFKSFFDESAWKRVKKGESEVDEEVEEEELLQTKKESKKSTIKKWIKDKKTCIAGTLHRSPLDPLFDEMEHYVAALEGGLKRVELQAEMMVKSAEKGGQMWMEFGLGCDAVGHVDDFIGGQVTSSTTMESMTSIPHSSEDEKQNVGQTFHTTSQTADALCTLYQKQHQTLLLNFLLPLRDHLKMIHAAKTALTKRSNRRVTYSTALSNVDSKKGALQKYRITQGMENKILNAQTSLSKAELEVENAKRKYDEVSERVLREFDRFKNETAILMHETMIEFGRVQLEHVEEMTNLWRSQKIGAIGHNGRCYVDAAKILMDANANVGGGHIVSMPANPPPPIPQEEMGEVQNGIETLPIQGVVKYRDPLPEE